MQFLKVNKHQTNFPLFQRTNWLYKSPTPHIYKGTQAPTRQQTFVECCLQMLPKPLDTIKTIPFNKSASTLLHRVWRYWGRTLFWLDKNRCASYLVHQQRQALSEKRIFKTINYLILNGQKKTLARIACTFLAPGV
jgi:hypothetical protein